MKRTLPERKPKVTVICGSSRFCDIMAVCAWLIEREEGNITMSLHLLPQWYSTKPHTGESESVPDDHLAEVEGVADNMDLLHLRKIDLADEIFVVNFDDYIGDSTKNEIEYAKKHSKPIRWFTHERIGNMVKEMLERNRA